MQLTTRALGRTTWALFGGPQKHKSGYFALLNCAYEAANIHYRRRKVTEGSFSKCWKGKLYNNGFPVRATNDDRH